MHLIGIYSRDQNYSKISEFLTKATEIMQFMVRYYYLTEKKTTYIMPLVSKNSEVLYHSEDAILEHQIGFSKFMCMKKMNSPNVYNNATAPPSIQLLS